MGKVGQFGLGLLGMGIPMVLGVGIALADTPVGQASTGTVTTSSSVGDTSGTVLATTGYQQMSSTLAQTAPQLTVTQTWHIVTTPSGSVLLIDPPHVGCTVTTSGL